MSQAAAETFAAEVLAWLASDHGRIGAFLGWSGESTANLAQRVDEPEFLLAIIDYLMLDEAQLLAACSDLGHPPETPLQARQALPGGAEMHWT